MGLFSKLFPEWEPLVCKPWDVVDLIQECLDINAPLCRLVLERDGVQHKVGVTSDYDKSRGFFDIVFYLDEQEFETLADFCRYARMDAVCFMDMETVNVLMDEDTGNPRNNVLLEKREIKT